MDVQNNFCYLQNKHIPTDEFPAIQKLGASVRKKERKEKELNPDTQQAILEIATVRRLQNEVDYENAFTMRFQKIRLNLEDAE